MNKKKEILSVIGLSIPESKVYLELLQLKEAKTGEICKKTEIASSNIYPILDSLISKGLVSYRMQNNIKIFMPAPPESLNEVFIEQQKKIETERKEFLRFIEELKENKPSEESYSKYKYYEGIVGIKSMEFEIISMIPNLNKNSITKLYAGNKKAYESLLAFYENFHKVRMKRGIKHQAIYPIEDKKTGEKRKKQNSEIRYMNLKNEAEWGIIGNAFFIKYITSKTPRGFLIQDEKFAKTFEQVFEQLWEVAKK
ncbi:MAG: helix-turn-helix domain-containing protein [Candidatus Pacearchaeota archaeon]|jgi:sugar-specific transcriptional regulator TrmB